MTRQAVITTINQPTEAVRALTAQDVACVVVGDTKTPAGWAAPGATYLGLDDQHEFLPKLSSLIPTRHYARKMIGYLWALQEDPAYIAETDDDNIAQGSWVFPDWEGIFDRVAGNAEEYVNVYKIFTDQHIWPRGLPLDAIHVATSGARKSSPDETIRVGVWQGLADGDPDVDAIYRLTQGQDCRFRDEPPVVLEPGQICPYNSQNTATRTELAELLYLPCTVTFRFTDILRGIVAQPIMWAAGFRLGFSRATVFQERNEHDLMRDFADEIPCYTQVRMASRIAKDIATPDVSPSDNLYRVYAALAKAGIVLPGEMEILGEWLKSVSEVRVGQSA